MQDPQTATLVAARVEDGARLGGIANGGFSAGSSTEQEAVMMMGGRFAGHDGEISASSGSSKMDPAAFRISFGGSKQLGGVDIWSAFPGGAAAGPSDGVAGGNACQTSPSLFPSTSSQQQLTAYTSSAQVPFLQPHQQAPSLFGGMQIQSSQQHMSTLFGGPQKGVDAPALTAPFATTTPFAGASHSSPSIFAPLQQSTASGPSSLFSAPPTQLTHQTFDTTSRPQHGVFSFAAPLQPPSHLQCASATPAGSSTGDSAATSTSRKANGAICGGGAGSDECIDLCTGDGFPLGRLSGAQVKRSGIKAGDLVRCKIWGPGYGAGGPPCAVREAGDALSEPAGVYMSAMAFPAAEPQTASASAFSSDLPRGSSLGGEVEGGVAMEDSSSVGVGECGAELGSRLLQGSALRHSDATGGGGGGTDTAGGIPLVANLMVEKKLSAAASKMADPWSKIMFHAMLAVRPVTIDDILFREC